MKSLLCMMFILLFATQLICQTQLEVASLFTNNMVLQQKTKAQIWGKSKPNSEVKITTSWGENIQIKADNNSRWTGEIQTPEAGGPYKISINSNDETKKIENVLIGEVWLCSGQSNMEMELKGNPPSAPVLNSEEEIKNASYPNIRLFSVRKIPSLSEEETCQGEWEECNPKTAPEFSAVAYFFGMKLYRELNTPIGLIESSWGGTPAEAWTSKKYLAGLNDFDEELKKLQEAIPSQKLLSEWLLDFPTISVKDYNKNHLWNSIELNNAKYSVVGLDDYNWESMTLPTNFEETKFGEFNGFIWFRKKVSLPDKWIGEQLTLELGTINDYDVTYFNGEKIGSTEVYHSWKVNRIYTIPKSLNNKKEIVIAIRVHDTGGSGGIYGSRSNMRIISDKTEEEISLAGDWKYLPIAELYGLKYYVFSNPLEELKTRPKIETFYSQVTPTVLYNSMIHPLIPFSIKGVIWYQGESNTNNPKQYERLFPAMIYNWRNNWGYNFPFYFVQIAPCSTYGDKKNTAYLRDAQRKTLKISNSGMVVTLDIGDYKNIHPANKKDVGERLALIALANQYKQDIVYSGPLYNSMQIIENEIILTFDHVGTGLLLQDGEQNNQFLISSVDEKFIPAKVKISGDKVIVWSDEIDTPIAVRYAWSNTPNATLFNKEGLPASSFRTDDW